MTDSNVFSKDTLKYINEKSEQLKKIREQQNLPKGTISKQIENLEYKLRQCEHKILTSQINLKHAISGGLDIQQQLLNYLEEK